jgi:MtN3 and saliva related transmembrane protein
MPMSTSEFTEGIGFVAAACTTLAFIPQLVKIRKQGGRDLSYVMLSVYLIGLGLWLVYGMRLHAPAVMAANVVGIVLVGAALFMKREADMPKPMPPVEYQEEFVRDNPLGLFPAYPAEIEPKKLHASAHYASR